MHRYLIDIVNNTLKNLCSVHVINDGLRIVISNKKNLADSIDISKNELLCVYPHINLEAQTKLMALLLGSKND